ncbi:MAG: D-alanyl-D-alanine carboxypeptidase [Ruminococcaceae bacterium]|nr:D-alanyl-D-alanine carboxypeptidase [Oscillospiraceae bacterium]
MKKFRISFISFLLIFVFCLQAFVFADSGIPTSADDLSRPEVSARAYVVADARTGEILFAKDENARMPIASTTKILTCLVALENSKLSDSVTVKADSCSVEGSSMYLFEGEKLTVKDLLYGLMLESANDAALCIANHVSGSVEAFAALMNERAKKLGLTNSHFNNPHGLEDPEHYSTARDMALIWCEAMKNEDFRRIVSTKTYRMDLEDDDGYRYFSNHNKLLKTYDLCIGGKTGFTKTAGRCLISGAAKNGAELVMVTLNAPDDWQDHREMMDYALSLYSSVEVATSGAHKHTIPVVGGKEKSVTLKNRDSLSISLRDVTKLEIKLEAPRFVYAPITDTNKAVAKMVYTLDGKEIASLPLYPEKTVKAAEKKSFFQKILNIFK